MNAETCLFFNNSRHPAKTLGMGINFKKVNRLTVFTISKELVNLCNIGFGLCGIEKGVVIDVV